MAMLAGDTGVELGDDLLPACVGKRLVIHLRGRAGGRSAIDPDIRVGAVHPQQERASHLGRLAQAHVGVLDHAPCMAAAADRAGVLGEWREAFAGQLRRRHGFGLFFGEQAHLVQGHAQVDIDTLLGGAQVAPRIELMRRYGHRFVADPMPAHHTGGSQQDEQAEQADVQRFMARPGRADDVGDGRAHGASMSAWSISTTWPGPASNST